MQVKDHNGNIHTVKVGVGKAFRTNNILKYTHPLYIGIVKIGTMNYYYPEDLSGPGQIIIKLNNNWKEV